MSGFSGGGATAEFQSSLLEVLKNPDAARKAVAQLQKAQEAADEAREAAQAAQRQAAMDRATVDAKLQDLAKREAAHAAAVTAFNAERDKASTAMALREHGVAYRLAQLDKGNAELLKAREQFDSDQATRLAALSARETALNQRATADQERERQLAERRAALRMALAD